MREQVRGLTYRQLPADEQARHDSAVGRLQGYLAQLRMSQRNPNYQRVAAAIFRELARLATSEAKSLEESDERVDTCKTTPG